MIVAIAYKNKNIFNIINFGDSHILEQVDSHSNQKYSFQIINNKTASSSKDFKRISGFKGTFNSIIGVVGKNGTGKTTLLKDISWIGENDEYFILYYIDGKYYYRSTKEIESKIIINQSEAEKEITVSKLSKNPRVIFMSNTIEASSVRQNKDCRNISNSKLINDNGIEQMIFMDMIKQITFLNNKDIRKILTGFKHEKSNKSYDQTFINDIQLDNKQLRLTFSDKGNIIKKFKSSFGKDNYRLIERINYRKHFDKETNRIIDSKIKMDATVDNFVKVLLLNYLSILDYKQEVSIFDQKFDKNSDSNKDEIIISYFEKLLENNTQNKVVEKLLEICDKHFGDSETMHFLNDKKDIDKLCEIFSDPDNKELISIFKIKWVSISSGEYNLFNLLGRVYFELMDFMHDESLSDFRNEKAIKNNSISLVIDEIDLGLHPSWQINLLHILITLLFSSDLSLGDISIDLYFSTHSPLVLSDLPSENLIFLNEYLQNYSKNDMEIKTFGQDINVLLNQAFFTQSNIGTISKNEIIRIIKNIKKYNETFKSNEYEQFNQSKINSEIEDDQSIIKSIGNDVIRSILEKDMEKIKKILGRKND